jgi:uroporphyrin-III C-methyltransferase / precorrin-2 dehydrogenase / sirohydrochlorin ferrochelatase
MEWHTVCSLRDARHRGLKEDHDTNEFHDPACSTATRWPVVVGVATGRVPMTARLKALAFRRPEEASPRMRPLSRLPVFLALEGKRAVVCGTAAAATWKAELLSAAGAEVEVFCKAPGEELRALAAGPPHGRISLVDRAWQATDLAGAAVAIGAITDDAEAERFATAARRAGVPVNVVDKPRLCDFIFGAVVNRSPLVIGISTDGAAPVFAQAVRAKIEGLLPRGFARWAEAARRWRTLVQATDLPAAARRLFWQLFTATAFATPDRDPATRDFDELLALTRTQPAGAGRVTLVGAGPGNPELLTLRAVRALHAADVILFDDLVSPDILDFARREAKKMLVGKTGHRPSCKQEEINTLMVSLARAGKHVVRLKGGDPMIFGRADEEIEACHAAGIAVEVVPGISTAQAAASRLGVSLTHRRDARRVQFVTAHADNGALPDNIDWQSIADPVATTAVYMPGRTIEAFTARAIAAGLDPGTPAIAVAALGRSGERIVKARLGDIAHRLAQETPPTPLLVLIGRTLDRASQVDLARATRSEFGALAAPARGAGTPQDTQPADATS